MPLPNTEAKIIKADFGKGPIDVYVKPWNLRERRIIRAALDKGEDDFALESLVQRARDKNGQRLWPNAADRDMIEREFDPSEIDRVVRAMYDGEVVPGN